MHKNKFLMIISVLLIIVLLVSCNQNTIAPDKNTRSTTDIISSDIYHDYGEVTLRSF